MGTSSLDLGLNLLDRQVQDRDGNPIGKVDDLLFEVPDDGGPPVLTALLLGQQALGARLGGRLGRWWTRTAQRLSGEQNAVAIPLSTVREIGVLVTLDAGPEELEELARGERWLREAFIGRIPGAAHESD